MFHVNESRCAAQLLGFSHNVLADGGLAGGFRPVDLGDPGAGNAADAQGDIQREGPRGDRVHRHVFGLTEPHDCAFAIPLGDVF